MRSNKRFGRFLEVFSAGGRAKEVRLTFIFGGVGCSDIAEFHTTHRVFVGSLIVLVFHSGFLYQFFDVAAARQLLHCVCAMDAR